MASATPDLRLPS